MRRGCREPPSRTASPRMRGGWKAASPASPIAPIPAPRSSKCRAISRPSWRKPASRRCSPATPMPAAAFPSRKHRRAADPADVGGRFQLSLLCGAQDRRRARDLCQRHRQREQPRDLRAAHDRRTGAIENKMVDAAAMAKGLRETGRIALYGIYFDTDKAVVKPESRPTLEQIAKLLAASRSSASSSSATPTTRGHTPTISICRAAAPRRSPPNW